MINRRAFGKLVGAGAVAALAGNWSSPSSAATSDGKTKTSFDSLKQINAGVLNIGYAEAGPADGPAVILLHGWPYDIHSFVDVAPLLAEEGYRVIVPYLRGHGTTRFLSDRTFRNAQQSVIALDIIALMDALKIDKAVLAGFDWGSRTADIIAALWPERCKALVSVSGYLITNREAQQGSRCRRRPSGPGGTSTTSPPSGAGSASSEYRHDFAKLVWKIVSPTWDFDDATFERTAAAFDNPDYVRHRDPQLPLAAESGRGRPAIRPSREAARRRPRHRRAHDHP